MTIHPFPPEHGRDALTLRPQQERPDTTSPYDTTWTEQPAESQPATGLDRIMGTDGKIYVVLAVVLLIWFGVLVVLFRTDRRIDRLERRLERDISEDDPKRK